MTDTARTIGTVEPTADMWDAARAVEPDVVHLEARRLAGGSSADVALLRIGSSSSAPALVVFRQHTDRVHHRRSASVAAKEFKLTSKLHDLGMEVPRPLAVDGGPGADGTWLATEFVEATSLADAPSVDAAIEPAADFLARLHGIEPDELAGVGLVEIEDPARALHRYLPDDEVGRVLTDTLARGVPRRPNPSVVIHGDYWPGNLLFDDDTLVAVIDWEDAQLADPLADLACARVELTCAFGGDAATAFTNRYRTASRRHRMPADEHDEHDLALWDAYVSATALASMHRWGLTEREESVRRAATHRFLTDAARRLATG